MILGAILKTGKDNKAFIVGIDAVLTEQRHILLTILFYYFTVSLTGNVLGQQCADIASVLCWVVAAVTAISGIKYLWDNRSFINTAK